MAKNNFTFQTVLRLNSKEFEKGISQVKRALNGLKSSFMSVSAALGAGLGLNKIISSMKETALSLSTAKAVLKNVSTEVDEAGYKWDSYASNLEYVRRLAKEYGQDLTNLIEGFGQFHAAANLVLDSNGKVALSLEDQKYIYEQLTKAAAGYHMSADRTRDMMNAITQMMSKGKVAAEELRRQLGNSLPGAFGLMATAMGVTTTELEDMMRKGQVLAADALPKFAKELERVTKGMTFDSLQQSLNRFKNNWTQFVESADVERMYKSIIDTVNNILTYISSHMSGLKGMIAGALSGLFGGKLVSNLIGGIKTTRAEWITSLDQITNKVQKLEKGMTKVKGVFKSGNNKAMGAAFSRNIPGAATTAEEYQKALKYAIDYNNALREQDRLQKNITGKGFLTKADLNTMKAMEHHYKLIGTDARMLNAATSIWGKGLGLVKSLFTGIWTTVKAIFVQFAAMAIIGAIVGLITRWSDKQKAIKEYAEETAKIYSNYKSDIDKIDSVDGENIANLKAQQKILNECERGSKEWAGALQEVNTKLGLTGNDMLTVESKQEDINAAVDRWISRLRTIAKINRNITHQQEAEEKAEDLRRQIQEKAAEYKSKTGYELGGFMDLETGKFNDQLGKGNVKSERWIRNNVMPLIDRLKEVKKVSDAASKSVEDLAKTLYQNGTTTTGDPIKDNDDDDPKKETDISKIYKNWTKEKKELNNQLKEHAITQEKYNEEWDKLVQKYYEDIAATGSMSIEKILEKADKGKALTAMEKWYKEVYDAAGTAAQNALLKAASDAIDKSLDEAIEEMEEALDKEMEKFMEHENEILDKVGEAMVEETPRRGKRDTTFDYKADTSDILKDEMDLSKARADALMDLINKYKKYKSENEYIAKLIAKWTEEYRKASKEADNLEKAMKIAAIQEDLENLNEEINKAAYGGIKNMASSMDRVVSGFRNLRETMEDPEATEWEQLMAMFNQSIQIIDTVIGMVEALQTITKLQNQADAAKIELINQQNEGLLTQLGIMKAIHTEEATGIQLAAQSSAASALEAANSQKNIAAKSGEAIAGATASGAKIPFPYNLIAIAAGVAAVIGALASIGKYANGGIVGGNNYSGDKQLARVNSGEMVLNRAQQGTLWNILNGKGGLGGNVQFKIRGTDLIGVMNNEMSRRKG